VFAHWKCKKSICEVNARFSRRSVTASTSATKLYSRQRVFNETQFFALSWGVYISSEASQSFFDGPLGIGFSFSLNTSSFRGYTTKMERVSSAGLVDSTAHRLVFMEMLKDRFTNSLRFVAAGGTHRCKGCVELAPAVLRQSRLRPAGQIRFLDDLPSSPSPSSSSLALLRSMVGEKRIFPFLFQAAGDDGPRVSPTFMSITFTWIPLFLQNECIFYAARLRCSRRRPGFAQES